MSSLETERTSKSWLIEAGNAFSSKPITERRFIACFGATSLLVQRIWTCCDIGMTSERLKPKDLLWTLYWMRVYPTEDVAMAVFGVGSRNTWVKKLNLVFGVLDQYLPEIDWEHRLDYFLPLSGVFEDYTFCVAGIECKIDKPTLKLKERLFRSAKSKSPCIRYEIATQISTGHIIRVSEPFQGSLDEKRIFKEGGLLELARSCNEKGLAGTAYTNDEWDDVLTHMKQPAIQKRQLSRLETLMNCCVSVCREPSKRINGLLKIWGILSKSYRGNIEHHERIFKIACRLTNMRLDDSPLAPEPHPVLRNLKFTFKEPKSLQDERSDEE